VDERVVLVVEDDDAIRDLLGILLADDPAVGRGWRARRRRPARGRPGAACLQGACRPGPRAVTRF
jgi:hypothetical protein